MAADSHPIPPVGKSPSRRSAFALRPAAFLLLTLGLPFTLKAEDTLQSLLGEVEYRAAGLDKLTPDERASLLRSLQQRGLGPLSTPAAPSPAPVVQSATVASRVTTPPSTPAASATAPVSPATAPAPAAPASEKKGLWARIKDFGAEQLPLKDNKDLGEVTEVEAQMIEPFHGLQGRTIFRLDNGQVWQQRIAENYYLGTAIPNPKVILRRTRFGYRLAIPAVSDGFDVAVKRIQ